MVFCFMKEVRSFVSPDFTFTSSWDSCLSTWKFFFLADLEVSDDTVCSYLFELMISSSFFLKRRLLSRDALLWMLDTLDIFDILDTFDCLEVLDLGVLVRSSCLYFFGSLKS